MEVGVSEGVGDEAGVSVASGVAVSVAVGDAVFVGVSVAVGLAVAVGLGVTVQAAAIAVCATAVCVEISCGVGPQAATANAIGMTIQRCFMYSPWLFDTVIGKDIPSRIG